MLNENPDMTREPSQPAMLAMLTSRRIHITRDGLITLALLAAIMLFGAYLRFIGQNWDDFTDLHPDERFMTQVVSEIGVVGLNPPPDTAAAQMAECTVRYPDTHGVGGYFDALCSNLYPPNVGHNTWVYGELPLFIVRFSAQIVAQVTSDPSWAHYDRVHFVGRTVSALADIFTILFIFLIGRRLYGRWTGLLAALLYGVAVLPIQLSHFWTADAFSNLPVIIAVYFAVRALDLGDWRNYLGFGIALGAAVASRVNTAPLAGLIVLVGIIRTLPVLDVRVPRSERALMLRRAVFGVLIAGMATLIVFRFAYPHAFSGPSIIGFPDFNLLLQPSAPDAKLEHLLQFLGVNPNFVFQLKQAAYFTSGNYDGPPNYQWINRPPYLFALRNIVEWGLGIPLGVTAVIAWVWAFVQMIRARKLWTRHALLVVWILVYFGYLGKSWVATMRYFMPLYPMLMLLAAWAMVELVKRARTIKLPVAEVNAMITSAGESLRRPTVHTAIASLILIFVTGFSVLWGFGFSRIYTRQLTRVNASQWFLRTVPGALAATINMPNGDAVVMNLPYTSGNTIPNDPSAPLAVQQKAPADGTFSTLTLAHVLDPAHTGKTTISAHLIDIVTQQPLASGTLAANFGTTNTSPLGDGYTIALDRTVMVTATQQIRIELYSDKAPLQLTGTNIAVEGPWDDAIPYKVCPIPASTPLTPDTSSGLSFNTCEGTDGFNIGYYSVPDNDGLYLVADDTQSKRDYIQKGMDHADYITISSNRFYDSLPRDPIRFPMTTNFYRALFAGQLGFDIEKTFTSYITIGPFTFPDEDLPTYGWADWTKDWWQVEEAFTVYDHPAVFVLKKNANYNPAAVTAVLNGTDITDVSAIQAGSYDSPIVANRIPWPTFTGNTAPSGFMMSPDQASIQQSGGTWSDLFHRDWAINAGGVFTVLAWWLALMIFGWIAWPILFTILPGLPDRGYPVAKLVGVLIAAWLVWVGGTLKFLTWSSPGIFGAMVLIALISGALALRQRAAFFEYIRTHRRHILIVEGLTFALFIGFVLVRLGNPDLWAQTHGGERPMDFAYFNAVLRSTVFPPYDPWYSGGFMNYYYFGFVLVATPVKLLGVMPSIAYNLVLPMLFAFTGIGAFSIAYNVVAWRTIVPHDDGDSDPAATFPARRRWALRAPAGSPYVAGIAALMLCVVLGNLDTPRVFTTGLASAGGYRAPTSDLFQNLVNDFVVKNGRAPTKEETAQLQDQANNPGAADQVSMEIGGFETYLAAITRGLGNSLQAGYLPISPERWYWGPSRVIGELPNNSAEITEFPYFTYIYADLHPHMIDMPVEMLALLWLLAEVLGVGVIRRSRPVVIASTVFGGLVVGVMYAINTWDWPVYMVLTILALAFTTYLRMGDDRRITRRVVLTWAGQIGLFAVVQQIAGLPFRTYFATAYTGVDPFKGNKTPIWAYLDIHGVFIFFLFSLLVWQTVRILRRTYVRDLIQNQRVVLLILSVIGLTVLATVLFGVPTLSVSIFNPPYPVAFLVFPLIGWATILFFLPNQSREMRALLALMILALALTFTTEMVTLQNDSGRQNTIFKLYMQAWLIFSVIAGVALAWLLRASERWRPLLRSPWLAFAALLLSVAALYPIMSTQGKIAMRMVPRAPNTLDGMEWMQSAVYGYGDKSIPLIDDYKLIRWLQDNIQGSPVILEAQMPEYLLGSRITMNTGLPTVLGYRFHQTQQRSIDPLPTLIWGRVGNVTSLYNTTEMSTTLSLLRFYNVSYIIVGGLERAIYTGEGLAKFDEMVNERTLKIVYNENGTVVYQVLPYTLTSVAQAGANQ